MSDSNQNREREEAIRAADCALEHLYAARDALGSAKNWGVFDIVGGGFFSTLIKQSKMSDAERELNAARGALSVFARELADVEGAGGVHIDTDDFVSAIDLFWDNPFVDLYVQGRINDARDQVEAAIEQVESVRRMLSR